MGGEGVFADAALLWGEVCADAALHVCAVQTDKQTNTKDT